MFFSRLSKIKISSFILGCFMCFPIHALHIGDAAPNFTLQNQDNKPISLSSFLGQYIVLYFYPKDNTPSCTKQACSIQADWDAFKKENIEVLGISYDSPKTHKKFSQKNNLHFNLLSDSSKKIAKQYGACSYFLGFMPLPFAQRKTFIIDPHGKIIDIIENVDVEIHTHVALKSIKRHKQMDHI